MAESIPTTTWESPQLRRALANRDIPVVYRLLTVAGVSQRRIAALTGQQQSEVSEIIRGRPVQSYAVLERIADGLGVHRGWLGLAYDEATTEPDEEEVDEQVERRKFIALTGSILFGAPILGAAEPLTLRDVISRAPERVGRTDVQQYQATVTRLGLLDREAGGIAAREALAATARSGEKLLAARADDDVHRDLRHAVSEAHRLAGWASGDVGMAEHCRWHMSRAVQYAADDRVRVAQVLCSAGEMEKHHGAPNDALKLFQLARVGTEASGDLQIWAVLHGLSAGAYVALGHPEHAREQVRRARGFFAEAKPQASLPFFAFYGPGSGLLAAVELKLANYEGARRDVLSALRTRPAYDVRCNALDTIVLATILINSGEIREGIQETKRALELVTKVGSQRVRDRLESLELALTARRDSTCTELARLVRALRSPQDSAEQ